MKQGLSIRVRNGKDLLSILHLHFTWIWVSVTDDTVGCVSVFVFVFVSVATVVVQYWSSKCNRADSPLGDLLTTTSKRKTIVSRSVTLQKRWCRSYSHRRVVASKDGSTLCSEETSHWSNASLQSPSIISVARLEDRSKKEWEERKREERKGRSKKQGWRLVIRWKKHKKESLSDLPLLNSGIAF
jgi:hypothetical protein